MGNIFGDVEKPSVTLQLEHASIKVYLTHYNEPLYTYYATDLDLLRDVESLRIRSESKNGDAEASATLTVIYALGMKQNRKNGVYSIIKRDIKKSRYYAQDKVFMTSVPKSERVQKMLDYSEKACLYHENIKLKAKQTEELSKKLNDKSPS